MEGFFRLLFLFGCFIVMGIYRLVYFHSINTFDSVAEIMLIYL